jgi:hypothetical protein
LNEDFQVYETLHSERLLTAISWGFFFILVGVIFLSRPNLYSSLQTFFSSDLWTNTRIRDTNVYVPVPLNPGLHFEVYDALWELCVLWGFFQVFMLAFRLIVHSSLRRTARTLSNAFFWLAAAYFTNIYLNGATTRQVWLTYWATIVILIGVTLLIRAAVLVAGGLRHVAPVKMNES